MKIMRDTEQLRASIAMKSPTDSILIQAGPGSGKTSLLVERLKYLLQNREREYAGVACITYTNSAKDEILERLEKEKITLPKEIFIGTIHSFLLENVIKPYGHFTRPDGSSLEVLPPGFAHRFQQEAKKIFDQSYIGKQQLDALEALGYDKNNKICCFRNIISYEKAVKWKYMIHEKAYIDQQDVIVFSYALLRKYEHIRRALSLRFSSFLVDEYQDVTWHQDAIFNFLNQSSFFCVGDFNQSIYSFTGASPEIFLGKLKSNAFTYYELENNFRSNNHIIEFANLKADIIQIGAGKNAIMDQKVLVFSDIEDEEKAIHLFHHIRENITYEESYKKYMILVRKNEYADKLNLLMEEKEIQETTFMQKLRSIDPRRFEILKHIVLAILYKRESNLSTSIEMIDTALSRIIFNALPPFIQLSHIGYNHFMWKKLQFVTLNYLETLDLKNTMVKDLFSLTKNFLMDISKKTFGISIGQKLKVLNYNWKGQKKKSETINVYQLLNQLSSTSVTAQKINEVYTIHNAKGQEAEAVLIMAENIEEFKEWLKHNRESEEARVGYVAFSRARKLLCIWAPKANMESLSYLENFAEFISFDFLKEFETV